MEELSKTYTESINVENDEWGNYTVSGVGTFDLIVNDYIYNTKYITFVPIIHVNVNA